MRPQYAGWEERGEIPGVVAARWQYFLSRQKRNKRQDEPPGGRRADGHRDHVPSRARRRVDESHYALNEPRGLQGEVLGGDSTGGRTVLGSGVGGKHAGQTLPPRELGAISQAIIVPLGHYLHIVLVSQDRFAFCLTIHPKCHRNT